jgi:hypothetical protein
MEYFIYQSPILPKHYPKCAQTMIISGLAILALFFMYSCQQLSRKQQKEKHATRNHYGNSRKHIPWIRLILPTPLSRHPTLNLYYNADIYYIFDRIPIENFYYMGFALSFSTAFVSIDGWLDDLLIFSLVELLDSNFILPFFSASFTNLSLALYIPNSDGDLYVPGPGVHKTDPRVNESLFSIPNFLTNDDLNFDKKYDPVLFRLGFISYCPGPGTWRISLGISINLAECGG